ncbi:ATP-dependent DNA ligase [Microbacterium telephonicum]|uniref:DNA ligase (ATP) n=1 Tax=Microbacterium telephonicum TaxID=1714841 RepID=A0A498C222_9MICO|nr:ATP-dependent DNA ligase [Microbacterium telephonicum]RLK49139.1 ATP-dependent DNA ligase LigD ligase module /ATP-dependent DNA ligase LigD phosphoesterase module /ATP-dependent DNA ligase LigD polymerase module [Microbacterium telephonicum]
MAADSAEVRVEGRRLRLTNLDKVLYPATGTTKGEVIDYYRRVAPALLPPIAGRPVTRKRWPEGTDHEPFFAKDLERGAPAWIRRMPIAHSSGTKDYPLVEDLPTLLHLAQIASLELHVPQWRFTPEGDRGAPDRLVLDLDPGPGVGLPECAEVARLARALLADVGLDAYPVTSGSKGIHLYAPLDGTRSSDDISAFAKELARLLEADHPDLVVSQMAKAVRAGRVFLDWSQNNGSKTTIAPYSLRGRPEPTVAAPRTWDELDDPHLAHLRFDEVLARLAAGIDPLRGLTALALPLDSYLAKRSAHRTPEPMPERDASAAAGDGEPRFVVQEHHARRLHYDLRLERDGVLVSWAVPRGIPDDAARNHLAVMTEPHPLEYLTFAGEIPAGEYGAGHMSVWDHGTYHAEKWRADEVIFTATGAPDGPLGTGRFALIRTSGDGEKSQWLLHRMKTDAAPADRRARAAPAEPVPPPGIPAAPPAPMLATTATPAYARTRAAAWGEPWVEFKWDGIRAFALWDGSSLRLRARSGTDITERYPELTAGAADLGAAPLLLDGEIVALDASGRPSFPLLQHRIHLTTPRDIARAAERAPVRLYLFDLLQAGGDDVTGRPLRERRALLERVAGHAGHGIEVPPVADDVDHALATARALSLEGVVVKSPGGRYRPGERSEEWLKVKLTRTQDVVIAGIRPGRGTRGGQIGSLLLGIPDADGLRYVGRVGTGFTDAELRRLGDVLAPLRTDENPLRGVPAVDARDALWVRPELVGEVEYAEATPSGALRHARWRGLRPDVSPDRVRPE